VRMPELFVGGLVVALLAGCGPPSGAIDPQLTPSEAGACPTKFEESFPETRAVDIGQGGPAGFSPYDDGLEVEVIQGNQGAFMITPWVRVKASPADGDEACFRVLLESDYQGALPQDPEGFDASQSNVRFVRDGGSLISDGALYNIFSHDRDELEDIEVLLTLTVQGSGFEGTRTVHIVLK
jgi:hypothetical protein